MLCDRRDAELEDQVLPRGLGKAGLLMPRAHMDNKEPVLSRLTLTLNCVFLGKS